MLSEFSFFIFEGWQNTALNTIQIIKVVLIHKRKTAPPIPFVLGDTTITGFMITSPDV